MSRAKFLAKFQNLKFWQFFKICNFDFVMFWLGIWCESLVWVIMGRRGGISERRRSSCSSCITSSEPLTSNEISLYDILQSTNINYIVNKNRRLTCIIGIYVLETVFTILNLTSLHLNQSFLIQPPTIPLCDCTIVYNNLLWFNC